MLVCSATMRASGVRPVYCALHKAPRRPDCYRRVAKSLLETVACVVGFLLSRTASVAQSGKPQHRRGTAYNSLLSFSKYHHACHARRGFIIAKAKVSKQSCASDLCTHRHTRFVLPRIPQVPPQVPPLYPTDPPLLPRPHLGPSPQR